MPCFSTRALHVGDGLRITRWACDGHDAPRPVAEVSREPCLMVVLRGRFVWRGARGKVVADPRTALAVDGGSEHVIRHPDGGDLTLAFSGEAVRPLVADGPRPLPLSDATYLRLAELARGPIDPEAALEVTHGVLAALGEPPPRPSPASASDREIALAIGHAIDDAAGLDVTLPDLAAAAGVSVAHACRAFRRATGGSIHRRVLDARLRHALALVLDSDRSLAEVALATGFANQGHLGNAFTARFGTSPGRARREPATLAARLTAVAPPR